MTAASLPADLRPRLGELVVCLGSDREAEVVAAAREITHALTAAGFDLAALADVIASAPDPIIIGPLPSGRRGKGEPVSVRVKQAERLMRLYANPHVDLTKWERDFINSVVPALRQDMTISEAQANNVDRLLRKPRRRLP